MGDFCGKNAWLLGYSGDSRRENAWFLGWMFGFFFSFREKWWFLIVYFSKRKCMVFPLNGGFFEKKMHDFRVRSGILEEKMHHFWVTWGISEEKWRFFQVKWGFLKRKCMIFVYMWDWCRGNAWFLGSKGDSRCKNVFFGAQLGDFWREKACFSG